MKRCKTITCWTDYPFEELGDAPGKPAPIRHVNVISYDQNKYVTVSFENSGDFLSVKAGYLYSKPGRYGQVKRVNPQKLRLFKGNTNKDWRPWDWHPRGTAQPYWRELQRLRMKNNHLYHG